MRACSSPRAADTGWCTEVGARIAFGLAIFLSMTLLCGPASARQSAPEFPHVEQVPVRIALQYYDVQGRSSRALEESIRYNGPIGFDAETQANISSYWQYEPLGQRCHLTILEIPLDVTIRYPHWVDLDRASRQMRTSWERRMTVLEVHENGHALLAFSAALDLYNELAVLGRDLDCDSFNHDLEARTDAAMDALRRRHREYDRITEHGTRQNDYDWTAIIGPQSDP